MKLVVATPLYPPDPGGPATYAKLLEEELPHLHVEVVVVKFSDVRHLPKLIRHFVYYTRVLAAAQHADAVLALDPVSTGYPAMRAAHKAKKPFFVKVVGDYAWEQGRQRSGITASLDQFVHETRVPFFVTVLRRLQTSVARHAQKVIVPSAYLKRVVQAWGIPQERIVVIHNAITIPAEGTMYPAVDALTHPRICTVARLVPWKGIDGLIDAVARMRAHGTHASLLIVGDGPERERLETAAREKLVTDYFFTGALSHEDALTALKSSDVFALNTSYEGLSHVLIEALLLGVPVVTTPVGGNSEVTENGVDALWVEPGNSEQLSDALTRLVNDRAFAKQLSANGSARARERFNPKTLAKELVSVIVPV